MHASSSIWRQIRRLMVLLKEEVCFRGKRRWNQVKPEWEGKQRVEQTKQAVHIQHHQLSGSNSENELEGNRLHIWHLHKLSALTYSLFTSFKDSTHFIFLSNVVFPKGLFLVHCCFFICYTQFILIRVSKYHREDTLHHLKRIELLLMSG